ncbi:hypothetical protein [Deinococcus sp. ME38]|uniref:hypothetical protein n=1 Tax=Deinococcus sp. ME38 TaxID=3400344 RepID=UPI003B58F65F
MNHARTQGFALVLALSLVALLALVIATYSIVTVNNARSSASSSNSSSGFYAAEAVLNARAEEIRQKFKGFQTPTGSSPASADACADGNKGSGDLECRNVTIEGRTVTSYVTKGAETSLPIPAGEDFAGLIAQETPFTVYGDAKNTKGNSEAIANLTFRSRLVPLFQFAVFFDKDVEFDNTATLDLAGPVHSNGNIFLDSGTGGGTNLTVRGQVTSSFDIWRGVKQTVNNCKGVVNIADAGNTLRTVSCDGGNRKKITGTDLNPFQGKLKDNMGVLEVPTTATLQPRKDAEYWQKADARIILKKGGSLLGLGSLPILGDTWSVLFAKGDGSTITMTGSNCLAAFSVSNSFRDNREAGYWDTVSSARSNRIMLDVDTRLMLACLHDNRTKIGREATKDLTSPPAFTLDEESDGGLVLYFTVDDSPGTTLVNGLLRTTLGTGSDGIAQTSPGQANNYAIRLKNGASLTSTNALHPKPVGITFISDQAMFIQGNFNSAQYIADGWIPSAVISDSVNVLSSAWDSASTCQLIAGSRLYYMNTASNLSNKAGGPINFNGQDWYYYFNAAQGQIVSGDAKSQSPLFCRNTANTTVRTAILAGTSTTGGEERKLYNDSSSGFVRSGGVHNMMRFHEDWGSNDYANRAQATYTYRGSLVSLSQPQHAVGRFVVGGPGHYQPPRRDWSFEEYFKQAENLPPLTPRFVYLKQDNFTRNFGQ